MKSPRRCFILGICSRCKAPHLGKRSTPDPRIEDQILLPAIHTEPPVSLKNDQPSNGFNEAQPEIRTYGDVSGNENFFNEPSGVTLHSGRTTSVFPAAIFNPNQENVPSLLSRIIARLMKVHVPSDTGRGSENLFPVYSVFSRNGKDNSLEQPSTSAPKQKRRPMRNPVFMKHVQERDFNNPYSRTQRERESHLNDAAVNFLIKLKRFLSVKYAC